MIEPVVEEHDCELVDVEIAQNRGMGLLRITVDSRESDGRVPVERCAEISREIETLLDAAEAMSGAYRLEVSSPGLNRVLGREKDFIAAVGDQVKLRTRRPLDGRKRFTGRLLAVEPANPEEPTEGNKQRTMLKVEVEGSADEGPFEIPFDEVEKANTIYEFTSADFAKADKPGAKRSSGTQKRKSGSGR